MPANPSTLLSGKPPEKLAVVSDAWSSTYAELDKRSDHVADRLRRGGIGPGHVVAVSLTSRPKTLIALLATLKAEGVYLPLDPSAPPERNREISDAGRPAVVLHDDETAPDGITITAHRSEPAADSDTAYLIYTSGTTGKPKGVTVPRPALAGHLEAVSGTFGLSPGDRVLWFAAPHVDVSIEQMLAPLSAGATLVLRDTGVPDFAELAALVERHRVTVANLPAGYWNAFAAGLRPEAAAACAGLRLMISGSERISPRSVRAWRERLPHVSLINAYGPTECVITATTYAVPGGITTDAEIPIGSACGDRRLYVLDDALERVADGEQGELFVGGGLLASGYHGEPEATAGKFVLDPFAAEPGSRMYRTGDVVRVTDSGELEFLGRVDDQLKIRGHRVEPAETRNVLERHPMVQSCAVLGHEYPSGAKTLVAYVVAPGATVDELAAHAAGLLPAPLVPQFVMLAELPLTADGKLDRGALPTPESAPVADEDLSPTEELLAGIWAGMFGVDHVGRDDNFFALGGDSLAALKLIARLMTDYGPEVPARAVFSAPTLADLAAELDRIGGGPAENAGIPAPPEEDRKHALSSGQRSLWFLDRWAPGWPTYNVPWSFRLRGPVDLTLLGQAVDAVVARHAMLRAVFPESLGEPRRIIRPAMPVELAIHDLRAARSVADDVIREIACTPFDLARGPLLRAAAVRLDDEETVLLMVFHHIIWDEFSLAVFENDLAECYSAAVEGRPPHLADQVARYEDFVAWQQNWAGSAAARAGAEYWRRRLDGVPPVLRLPTDRPRPADQAYDGATIGFSLPPEVAAKIRILARQENVTAFLVLATACAVTLGRAAGQDDLVLGTPVAGRTSAEFDELIGYFVNLLPLRFDLGGGLGFRELLHRVRANVLPDFGHQDVPFETIVETVIDDRHSAHAPLVQAVFEMHAHDRRPPDFGPASVTRELVPTGTAKFDVGWQVTDDGDGFHGVVEFNTGLFDETTVRDLVEQWRTLLLTVLRDSEPTPRRTAVTGVRQHPARNDETPRRGNRVDFPAETTLHRLVEDRLRQEPGSVALAYGDRTMSRGELDREANRLAHRLRAMGVGPGVAVGVLAERSIELVVGLLAVLKAGGAYVPLEPELPAERIATMADEVEAPVVLCQRRFAGLVPSGVAATQILDEPEQWSSEPEHDLLPLAGPLDPAYVIFTSGSTGRPKAVATAHRAICNRLHWMQQRYELGADDVVLQKTPAGFDVSVWEFFWPLLAGARLVLARPGGHRDPSYLRDVIVEHGVTTVHFVPSMLAVFLAYEDVDACRTLRRTICSGEALPPGLVNDFFARLPGELHNLYGPTEAAIDVSAWQCWPMPESSRTTPIGTAISNVSLHVLDADGEPVPPGTEGELYIGGVGLAMGYVNQPALTADRFVPDPFAADGSRLYRTGDFARRGANGELEFLGRRDGQLKIRGQRVELGEIEAVLERHDAVARAVLTSSRSDVDHCLHAHVVLAPGRSVTAGDLDEYLRTVLPEHMIPARYTRIPEIPLTPNGKVDRATLLTRESGTALPRGDDHSASEVMGGDGDALEQVLAGIWSLVLDLPGLERDQDLFKSGAHSLNTLRARARITVALRTELPIKAYFEAKTIATLADRLRERADSADLLDARARAISALPPLGEAEWVNAVSTLDIEVS